MSNRVYDITLNAGATDDYVAVPVDLVSAGAPVSSDACTIEMHCRLVGGNPTNFSVEGKLHPSPYTLGLYNLVIKIPGGVKTLGIDKRGIIAFVVSGVGFDQFVLECIPKFVESPITGFTIGDVAAKGLVVRSDAVSTIIQALEVSKAIATRLLRDPRSTNEARIAYYTTLPVITSYISAINELKAMIDGIVAPAVPDAIYTCPSLDAGIICGWMDRISDLDWSIANDPALISSVTTFGNMRIVLGDTAKLNKIDQDFYTTFDRILR